MTGLKSIYSKFPDNVRNVIIMLPEKIQNDIEEIRIQIGQPICVRTATKELVLNKNAEVISYETMNTILSNLLNHSIYAYENQLAKGYITIESGHRIGVCGTMVKDNNSSRFLKDISSINVRRSREIKGCGDIVINEIVNGACLHNTIIVSPPKCGKTTLLRDIIRIISMQGFRVGVCDERSEIAGMYKGRPSFDLGPRTDVLDKSDKAEGMLMLIRSMAPDVIVTDEIGQKEDIDAIRYALTAGVKIITTIHGKDYDDLINSQAGELVKDKVFKRIIFLSNIPSTGSVTEVRHV